MRVFVTLERVAVPSFRPCFVFSFFSRSFLFSPSPFLLCIIVLFKFFQVEGRRKKEGNGDPRE